MVLVVVSRVQGGCLVVVHDDIKASRADNVATGKIITRVLECIVKCTIECTIRCAGKWQTVYPVV